MHFLFFCQLAKTEVKTESSHLLSISPHLRINLSSPTSTHTPAQGGEMLSLFFFHHSILISTHLNSSQLAPPTMVFCHLLNEDFGPSPSLRYQPTSLDFEDLTRHSELSIRSESPNFHTLPALTYRAAETAETYNHTSIASSSPSTAPVGGTTNTIPTSAQQSASISE